jgi:hypothetical protein
MGGVVGRFCNENCLRFTQKTGRPPRLSFALVVTICIQFFLSRRKGFKAFCRRNYVERVIGRLKRHIADSFSPPSGLGGGSSDHLPWNIGFEFVDLSFATDIALCICAAIP